MLIVMQAPYSKINLFAVWIAYHGNKSYKYDRKEIETINFLSYLFITLYKGFTYKFMFHLDHNLNIKFYFKKYSNNVN